MAVIDLTTGTFQRTIDHDGITVLDFWAPWCGPCKIFAPVFAAAAEQHPDIVFGKINTEEHRELAQQFNIRAIPTLMVFKNRTLVFHQAGAMMATQFEQLIQAVRELAVEEIQATSAG